MCAHNWSEGVSEGVRGDCQRWLSGGCVAMWLCVCLSVSIWLAGWLACGYMCWASGGTCAGYVLGKCSYAHAVPCLSVCLPSLLSFSPSLLLSFSFSFSPSLRVFVCLCLLQVCGALMADTTSSMTCRTRMRSQ